MRKDIVIVAVVALICALGVGSCVFFAVLLFNQSLDGRSLLVSCPEGNYIIQRPAANDGITLTCVATGR